MFKSKLHPITNLFVCVTVTLLVISCTVKQQNTRSFYKELVDKYLDAVVANDPSGLPLSPDVKYTEDTRVREIGEGLWAGATEAPTTFKVYVVDTISNQVGFYGVMKENDKPVILALRLKVENEQITEIEHVVARQISERAMKNLVTPRAGFIEPVLADQRVSREEMFNIANLYFEAIERDTGSIAPFADDCVRHENGIQTTTTSSPILPISETPLKNS